MYLAILYSIFISPARKKLSYIYYFPFELEQNAAFLSSFHKDVHRYHLYVIKGKRIDYRKTPIRNS